MLLSIADPNIILPKALLLLKDKALPIPALPRVHLAQLRDAHSCPDDVKRKSPLHSSITLKPSSDVPLFCCGQSQHGMLCVFCCKL